MYPMNSATPILVDMQRQGQKEGFVAGIVVSVVAVRLYKRHKQNIKDRLAGKLKG